VSPSPGPPPARGPNAVVSRPCEENFIRYGTSHTRVPVKVVLKRIAPLMHPNRLQFKRPGGLSWPACPCGSGDGPLYFWGAHLAKLSPFTCGGRQTELSCIKAHGNKTESHGPNKAHMQQKKSGHSPWRLSRANRALVGAHSWGLGGFLGGSGWAKGGRKE
jgi:hypothetical protein